MEEKILSFSKNIAKFCNHLQASSDALKQSVDRRPIPLDSASLTFIQSLNLRVTSASNDLNLLESMSFGTVSFEELLGHCNEVYKKNQSDLVEIEDRLKSSGYVPEFNFNKGEEDDVSLMSTPHGLELKLSNRADWLNQSNAVAGSIMKDIFDDDHLSDESLCLRSLGLSDACLATLASEVNADNGNIYNTNSYLQESTKNLDCKETQNAWPGEPGEKSFITKEDQGDNVKCVRATKSVINVSKDDYESLPSYLKSLASWEDLLVAVEKINVSLEKKENTKEANFFNQDEICSMELGSKGRSYLLLLLRMDRLVVETVNGSICYRVL